MTDLDELERKARAATPGPWRISDSHGLCIVNGDESALIADMSSNSDEGRWDGRREDAVFIVAARDVVLALIARVRAAESQLVDDGCDVCGAAAWTECATFCSEYPDNLGSNSLRLRVRQGLARIAELEAALGRAVRHIESFAMDVPGSSEWDWNRINDWRQLSRVEEWSNRLHDGQRYTAHAGDFLLLSRDIKNRVLRIMWLGTGLHEDIDPDLVLDAEILTRP